MASLYLPLISTSIFCYIAEIISEHFFSSIYIFSFACWSCLETRDSWNYNSVYFGEGGCLLEAWGGWDWRDWASPGRKFEGLGLILEGEFWFVVCENFYNSLVEVKL